LLFCSGVVSSKQLSVETSNKNKRKVMVQGKGEDMYVLYGKRQLGGRVSKSKMLTKDKP
jgi:predicted phage tail protein